MTTPAKQSARSIATVILMLLFGLPMLAGGAWLLGVGGAPWFLVAGCALVGVAWLAWARPGWAAVAYAVCLLSLAAWATLETGLTGWWWLPRVGWWWLLGWWWVMPWLWRHDAASPRRWCVPGALLIVALLGLFSLTRQPVELKGRLADDRADALAAPDHAAAPPHDWVAYGRSAFGDRYAPAAQITPGNVARLKLAWTYRVDAPAGADHRVDTSGQTPLAVNGLLYVCARGGAVVALDTDSGAERWRYNPANRQSATDCLGLAYYDSATAARDAPSSTVVVNRPTPKGAVAAESIHFESCPRRIFVPEMGGRVMTLNADNGERCHEIGQDGEMSIDLDPRAVEARAPVPPVVTRQVLIVSAGVVAGFDIDQGRRVWQWPASGNLRSWGVASVDEKLGLVYLVARAEGDDAIAPGAIVALNVATGEQHWVYQATDALRGQPVLYASGEGGQEVPALMVATRGGELVVLDRRNGKALTTPSDTDALSFAPGQALQERQLWGITPYDQLMCRIRFRQHSANGSLVFPGHDGVFDTGGIAVDPARSVWVGDPSYIAFVRDTEHGGRLRPLRSVLGLPCQQPPWGYVAAVDLVNKTRIWMRRNGVMTDRLPWRLSLPLGVPSIGGMSTTGGGVAFLGGTLDASVRAFDVRTGDMLWKAALPSPLQATPISFISDRNGHQYLVVVTAGDTSGEGEPGQVVMAYTLPLPGT